MKHRAQRGVALITVLLVMSLALLIIAGMLRTHRLTLHSSAQQIHQLQLRTLGFAGEAWALQRLRNLIRDPAAAVVAGQAWAQGQPRLAVDDGQVDVHIEDLAGRFNIAVLLNKDAADEVQARRWLRLQTLLELAPLDVGALQGRDLSDISQLRSLPGVDGQWWARMQPWIVLLGKDAALNINTAPATLLATLEGVTPDMARRLVATRPLQGYARVEDFTYTPALIGAGINAQGLGTGSRWFRITTQVRLGQSRLRLESDVARHPETGQWHLLQRRFLAPQYSESF